jgi:hypothetical protein
MNTTIEINKIIDDLKKSESDKRQRTSLYLAENLYREFRIACGDVPPSKVIESLMRAAIESQNRSA